MRITKHKQHRSIGFAPHGWGCGYIGVPKGHPWYEVELDDCDVEVPILVHGGVTFAANHLPPAIKETESDYWYVGFDTMHFGDTAALDESFVDEQIELLHSQAMMAITAQEQLQ